MSSETQAFIYKISWFQSKRHLKSHTNMYFLKPEHTHWVFERCPNIEPYRVELILVDKSSNEYDSAVNNSKSQEKEKEKETRE